MEPIPVALFAYNRPDLLLRTLDCLRENAVPLIYAFSDGPKTVNRESEVREVREILRGVHWCDVRLTERAGNLGLGKSILTGVAEVLEGHEMILVWEDDLVCVPGTYHYLCAALQQYRGEARVMSVTGWTHARVRPGNVGGLPYFDGRAECLVWGTWRWSWRGMHRSARTLMRRCYLRGIDPYRYGSDLVQMARWEEQQNIWAVRWLYLHILKRGLCLRPPWSMVEHIGNDNRATNAAAWNESGWASPPLRRCPETPRSWPEPAEHEDCPGLWQQACGRKPPLQALVATSVSATTTTFSRLFGALQRRRSRPGG
ncbi:MAG: hypothetical protein ABSA52_11485 [Candidatus Binatia bacterium]|jgi:hypothetical protein